MIIKGIFRRYERWNPVHPTMGTFWGMGIGVGCGVGWGPGFGPEVIGYVGAGCGVGFSVGFTVAGVGVGLPMSGGVPIASDVTGINDGAPEARFNALTTITSVASESWNNLAPHVLSLRKKTYARLDSFQTDAEVAHVELGKLKKTLSVQIQSTLRSLKNFKDQGWHPGEGWED